MLVGTVAYQVLGPHLGVIWRNGSRMTQDVDLASDNNIAIAVPDLKADVPAAIESLQMGFFPVPRLSRKEPSTSYAVRGKTLRVDLLTPTRKGAMAADKKRKDILQAGNMIALLKEDRPGDIELAREDLVKRGTSWIKKVEAACTEANINL